MSFTVQCGYPLASRQRSDRGRMGGDAGDLRRLGVLLPSLGRRTCRSDWKGEEAGRGSGTTERHFGLSEMRPEVQPRFIFPNANGGLLDMANYRYRVLRPLAGKMRFEKLTVQILRQTMANQAQSMGSVEDIRSQP